MSANGAVTTTIDFEFFGGGYTQLSGGVSATIEPSLVSYAKIPIVGQIQPVTIDFGITAGIETPTIYGRADLSFDFIGSGTAEFGVQRYATVGANTQAILFEYTANSAGHVITHSYFNNTLDFTLSTNIYVFSLGDSSGSYSFNVESTGVNVSTRSYSVNGANYCSFDSIDFNDVQISAQSNYVEIVNNGTTQAEILQK